jgi:hypothetical protein
MKAIVKAALAVAKHYPVFPTTSKKLPCWSNLELDVPKGKGGFHIASMDPARVRELFEHPHAETVSVPMGPQMSGLVAIDVDLYKGGAVVDWHTANLHWLEKTLCHRTQRGGLHYIFKCPDNVKFPATMAEGVDIKAHGGYVVFPPSGGYTVQSKKSIKPFPIPQLEAAMKAKGGTGNVVSLGTYNNATDEELIEHIQNATELYPALRSLAYRMPGRRQDDGSYLDEQQMTNILENVMDCSLAADASHPRHEDWLDRRGKISELVVSGIDKDKVGVGLTATELSAMQQGESFIKAQEMIAASSRPIGPQQEVSLIQIEALVGEMGGPTKPVRKEDSDPTDTVDTNNVVRLNAKELRSVTLPPIEYLIPRMMSRGGTCSLAGMSNVGKTRWMAALIMALAVGDTKRMGLPQCTGKTSSLYIANEEHIEDMARRFAAVCYQHDDKDSADIFVRGKKAGTFRLVAINETGHPEVDAKNVAWLVKEIRESEVKVLVMDPYVTLAEGGDENSSSTASMLTKAMLLIIAATDVCIVYPHHTPKGDRKADRDWPRGDSGAWRGSGAIYSSLDFGFTLANYYPPNPDQRKAWKQQFLSAKLSRFVVLDTGKIREGEPLGPVMYELVGQDMDKGEGDPIGVCRLTDEAKAANALLSGSIDATEADELSWAMINTMRGGEFTSMAKCHDMMSGHHMWPNVIKTPGKEKLLQMFGEKYSANNGTVLVTCSGKGKWKILIEEYDND